MISVHYKSNMIVIGDISNTMFAILPLALAMYSWYIAIGQHSPLHFLDYEEGL